MKTFATDFLETAVIGVVGVGKSGVASRCVECRWQRFDWGPCGGFGEGCLVQEARRPSPRPSPKGEGDPSA